MRVRLLLLAALLAGQGAAMAASPDCRGGVRSFYLENDLFHKTDRNYTSGVKLTWVSPDIEHFSQAECLPGWAKTMDEKIRHLAAGLFTSEARQRNIAASIGQEIYTPGDRRRSDLIREDRPYAGWLYLGLSYNERRGTGEASVERLDSLETRLGMVGPLSLARWSQDLIHDLRGFPKFQGWNNQLRNEPGLQVILERKYRARAARSTGDATLHFGGSAGNIATYANAGLELRLGTGIPDDFGSSPVRPAGNNTAPGAFPKGKWLRDNLGAHLFASLDARAVARDIFLDGNTFLHSHRVDRRPLVADIAFGVAGFAYGWKLSYARVIRSREFEGQPSRHSFGSITASHEFD